MWNEAAVVQTELLIQPLSLGTEENQKKICAQDSWFPGQDFNHSPLKYKAGVTITCLEYSVLAYNIRHTKLTAQNSSTMNSPKTDK